MRLRGVEALALTHTQKRPWTQRGAEKVTGEDEGRTFPPPPPIPPI